MVEFDNLIIRDDDAICTIMSFEQYAEFLNDKDLIKKIEKGGYYLGRISLPASYYMVVVTKDLSIGGVTWIF